MAYEVYVSVEHDHKHSEGDRNKLSDCAKLRDPLDEVDKMRLVKYTLEEMARNIDPDVVCERCGANKNEHYGYKPGGRGSLRCYSSQYGPLFRDPQIDYPGDPKWMALRAQLRQTS